MWNRQQHDTTMFRESKDSDPDQEASRSVESASSSQSETLSKRREGIVIGDHTATVDVRELGTDTDVRQMVAVGRVLTTNMMRDIVGREVDLGTWSSSEVRRFQDVIEQMAVQVRARIDKLNSQAQLAPPSARSVPDDFADDEAVKDMRYRSIHALNLEPNPYNQVFLNWSQKLLKLMVEKTHCTLYNPLPKYSDPALWQEFREE